jgi:hypothetical protein
MAMTSNSNLFNSIISILERSISNHPSGGFFFPLKSLLWLPIRHNATVRPGPVIKYNLMCHVKDHTYALDKSLAMPHRSKFKISAPTINKYLEIIEKNEAVDYNNKTWDHLFKLIIAAPLRNNKTVSQFWWSFCKKYYPEFFSMLFDMSDPHQSTADVEAFWLDPGGRVFMVNLSTIRFYSYYVVILKFLLPAMAERDNKGFKSGEFLKNVIAGLEQCAFNSNADLTSRVSQFS